MQAAIRAVDIDGILHAAKGDEIPFKHGHCSIRKAHHDGRPVLAFHFLMNEVMRSAAAGHCDELSPFVVFESQHQADRMDAQMDHASAAAKPDRLHEWAMASRVAFASPDKHRLAYAPLFEGWDYPFDFTVFASAFWLCYLVIFYAFYWKKISRNKVLWYVAGCSALLCIWNFLLGIYFEKHFYNYNAGEYYYSGNTEFITLTWLVIPAVLMAHAQFAGGGYRLKDAGKVAVAWLSGWAIKPFSGIPAFFEVIGSLFSGGNKSTVKKASLGAGVTLLLLCILVPLLGSADRVFGYYLDQIVGSWNIGSFVAHTIVVSLALILFYSFLWNVGFGKQETAAPKRTLQIDPLITCIVLSAVTALYLLFCTVQFTYLFAGAGLPGGMTYSEYAREGFAQTVFVCTLNLLIFGVFLQFGVRNKAAFGLLAALLGLTGVMLLSGFVRLKLYIDTYGLTWLRLLSAWFVIYLAVVVICCGLRMLKEKLPVIAVCAMILLGWYVILGYANPDALIERYNQNHGRSAAVTYFEMQ